MWIILRVLIGVIILFFLEYYFVRKLNLVFKVLFPDFSIKKKKIIIYTFVILLNLYPAILILNAVYAVITNQSVSFPQNIFADYLLLYPFWILILLILQVSVLFLFVDVFSLVPYFVYKNHREKIDVWKVRIFLALTLFFAFYVPGRIIYDYNSVNVRYVELKKENLPKDIDELKIAFITDVQADRYTDEARLKNYIDKITAQNPDLVLIAGDVITSTPDYINLAAKYLGKITPTYGTYSCVGDHDNWAYRKDNIRSLKEIKSALQRFNVQMLDNEIRYIEIDSSRVGITFITNTYVSEISETTLRNVSSSNNGDLKIFLTHQPQNFLINSAVNNKYDLFLAGHTHGGQITLVFPFIQLTPTLVETKYIRGEFLLDKTLAVVCGGLGMSLAPIRYNSTPEIIILQLKSK